VSNKDLVRRNFRKLIAYDQVDEFGGQDPSDRSLKKKLTLMLDLSYHDVLNRLKILEGTTKTEIVRRALDAYAEALPEGALYPVSSQ
jgi:hypothetical protein